MNLDKIRAKMISSVWQAVAQSGVDLSAVPAEQQEKLVGKIADAVLVSMDQIMDEEYQPTPEATPAAADGTEEHILWQGRPFLSLVEHYTLTTERLKVTRGLVGRKVENFELVRMQDIDYKQNIGERITNLGDITIKGQDASNPEIVMRNIAKPEEVYEIMRKAWLEARKRHGLQFREFM
ncbi:MAG TPA: hypothetical protein DCY42_02685 [Chloroflexi bacterium]|nr:hypothetical protein [Chloroflexota bacterium]